MNVRSRTFNKIPASEEGKRLINEFKYVVQLSIPDIKK